jgi:hypothetical protein
VTECLEVVVIPEPPTHSVTDVRNAVTLGASVVVVFFSLSPSTLPFCSYIKTGAFNEAVTTNFTGNEFYGVFVCDVVRHHTFSALLVTAQ